MLSTPREEAPDSRRTWTERRLKEVAVVLLRFPLALDVFLIHVGARSLPIPQLRLICQFLSQWDLSKGCMNVGLSTRDSALTVPADKVVVRKMQFLSWFRSSHHYSGYTRRHI